MIQIPDHPTIRSMERTGYPSWIKAEDIIVGYCAVCGKAIYEGDYYVDDPIFREIICEDCEEEEG